MITMANYIVPSSNNQMIRLPNSNEMPTVKAVKQVNKIRSIPAVDASTKMNLFCSILLF